jgi:signal transduction histidine kinase
MRTASDRTKASDRSTPVTAERAPALREFALRRLSDCELHRLRLSKLLHDELGQMLLMLHLDLYSLRQACRDNPQALSRLCQMRKSVEYMGRAVRKLAADLRPACSQTDIDALLAMVAERFRIESGMDCQYRGGRCGARISQAFAIAVHRLLLRALGCVAAAGVRRIELSAAVDGNAVTLVITDAESCVREGGAPAPASRDLEDLSEWIGALAGTFSLHPSGHTREVGRVVLPLG